MNRWDFGPLRLIEMRINQGLWLFIAGFGRFSLIIKQFVPNKVLQILSQLRWIYLDVNGQLTQEIFYEFHGIKDLSQTLFFSSVRTSTKMYTFCWTHRVVLTREAVKQVSYKRAPDLVWIGSYSLFGPLCSVSFFKFCLHPGSLTIWLLLSVCSSCVLGGSRLYCWVSTQKKSRIIQQ